MFQPLKSFHTVVVIVLLMHSTSIVMHTWEVSQPFPSDALIPWNPEENQHPSCISSISFFPHVLPTLQGLTCIKLPTITDVAFFLIAILAIEHRLSYIIDI